MIGFDARLQLLHYDDLVAVLHHATLAGVHGTFNVAGDGVLMMSQVLRRLGRVALPLPPFAMSSLGSLARQTRLGLEDFSPEQVAYLTYGRGLDTTRMRTVLGLRAAVHHRAGARRVRHRAGAEPARATTPWSRWRACSREHWEASSMADAEIIPLGTRGRPGRGTGRDKPSSSSRSLAGGRRRRATPRRRSDADAPTGAAADADRGDADAPAARPRRRAAELDGVAAAAVDAGAGRAATTGRRTATSRRRRRSGARRTRPAGLPGSPAELPFGELLAAATRAAQVVFGEDADQKLAELLAFLRRRVTGDYAVDEYGMDPEITERFLLEMVRPLATKWFRVEVRGVENIPTEGGALVVANHSGTVPVDGLITMFAVHETTGRNLRPLGADLVFRLPFVGELARKAGATLACNEDADPDAQQGRARRGLAGGVQGHRQALLRALQAAALRPRRLRLGGDQDRGADRAVLDRRRGGDLPAGRQHPGRWPGCSACPTSRSRRSSRCSARWGWCRCRRSGSSSSGSRSAPTPTTPARPTTRCWSSTSPTRCARRSSRRSTHC